MDREACRPWGRKESDTTERLNCADDYMNTMFHDGNNYMKNRHKQDLTKFNLALFLFSEIFKIKKKIFFLEGGILPWFLPHSSVSQL